MAAMLVLSTVAVVATSAATAVLRSYLFNRVDNNCTATPATPAVPDRTGSQTGSIFIPRGSTIPPAAVQPAPAGQPVLRGDPRRQRGRDPSESSQLDIPTAAPRLPEMTIQQAKNRSGTPFNVVGPDSKQARGRVMSPLPDGSGSLRWR